MKKKLVRLPLVREFENPELTIKVEFWQNAVLVFGLREEKHDYIAFPSFESFVEFWQLNFE